ncbi:hypothetical protein AB205_0141500 [Aquarana catesbeiana]|uniref:Uncharacterized protein n=1 Tax=Aquarana catesbeiana TaxID=8400 RepID=A0A2G9QJE3_AQUCT|nr:hypothetical protein AB205_0141500 [Aquarana catesbeiana]
MPGDRSASLSWELNIIHFTPIYRTTVANPVASEMHRFVTACPCCFGLSYTCTRARFIVSRSGGTIDSCLSQDKTFQPFHCYALRSDLNPVASKDALIRSGVHQCFLLPHFSTCSRVQYVVSRSRGMTEPDLCHGKIFHSFHDQGKHFIHFVVATPHLRFES